MNAEAQSSREEIEKNSSLRLCVFAFILLFIVSIVFRFIWLDTIPGINGDEAQTAVEVQKMLAGQTYSFRTPTGQFFNPIMLGSEALLAKIAAPSFFMLRIPSPIWVCVGLWLNFLMYRR